MTFKTTCSFLAILMLTAATATAQPQTIEVRGTVLNIVTGDSVPNATVVLESPAVTRQVKAGADGRFSLSVPPGPYHLSVRADGYTASRTEITVATGMTDPSVTLAPDLHFSEVISVSPDSRNQFDAYQPTNVLGGQELTKELQSTVGATVENEAGIALRSFGPGPARPVIRGLDGDRVLILEDGLRMGDLSSQSGDHGVTVSPTAASRIEIVRGPATLLYGANAIGGLVNVVTDEIPNAPVKAPTGSVTIDGGTNAGEGGGSGSITAGRGAMALHLSGGGHRAGDFSTPDGDIPNSFSRSGFAELGLAYTGEKGFFGGSYGYDRTHYGIPYVEEGETNLDPRRHTINLRGERRNMGGLFETLRGSFGVRRYSHDELDGEEIATSFKNNTTEFELLASHRQAAHLKGSIGVTLLTRSFSAEGEEALSPPVDQKGYAGYLYEELTASPHVAIQFGGRFEHAAFTPEQDEPDRNFTDASGSIGLLLRPSDATTIAVSLASAARNPALEELYFHGPHAGNNAFENGDPDLDSENATGFDLSFRWRKERTSGEATFFYNSISNFIFRQYTGEVEDDLPVTFFTQGDARLQGFESHIDVKFNDLWAVEAGLDYTHGELTTLDQPMPRIPPLRGRLGLNFQKNAFQAGADVTMTSDQNRVFVTDGVDGPVGETPTDGYNLVKLFGSYSFGRGTTVNTITLRLDNATDELYHNHLNYLKDLAPEMGVTLKVVYSARF